MLSFYEWVGYYKFLVGQNLIIVPSPQVTYVMTSLILVEQVNLPLTTLLGLLFESPWLSI